MTIKQKVLRHLSEDFLLSSALGGLALLGLLRGLALLCRLSLFCGHCVLKKKFVRTESRHRAVSFIFLRLDVKVVIDLLNYRISTNEYKRCFTKTVDN